MVEGEAVVVRVLVDGTPTVNGNPIPTPSPAPIPPPRNPAPNPAPRNPKVGAVKTCSGLRDMSKKVKISV